MRIRPALALLAALLLAPHPGAAQAPARPATPAPAPAAPAPAAPAAQGGAERPAAAEKPVVLRVEQAVVLRGPGGRWGAPVVDELNRRLYLPRGPAGLTVLALDGLKTLADIADTAGSAAVALDPETLRGFSGNALETKAGGPPAQGITVFDQRGFKPIAAPALATLAGVRHLLYDAATKQVLAGGDEGQLALIDPAKLSITTTLALEGKRIGGMAADRRGRLFVSLPDRDALAVVNLVSRAVATTWKPEGCRQPGPMVFDSVGMRLILVCRGGRAEAPAGAAGAAPAAVAEAILVLDVLSGRVMGRLPGPPGVEALIHDPQQRLFYAASAVGASVMVYRQPDPYRYEAAETVGTRPLAALGAVDQRTGRLFLATAEYALGAPRADGTGGGMAILPHSYTLLALRRQPME